jgi:hypothetical protein
LPEPAYVSRSASPDQPFDTGDLHGLEIVARTVLQRAGAIDHGTGAAQQRRPGFDGRPCQIGRQPGHARKAPARRR